MGIRRHHSFREPDSDDVQIWRYIDVPKLLALVQSSSLFFVRVDKLSDPYEAVIPEINLKLSEKEIREQHEPEIAEQAWLNTVRLKKNRRWYVKNVLSRFTVVSCWHAANGESDAMWKLYGGSAGVAVRSTFGRLKTALSAQSDHVVHLGLVNYIDADTVGIPEDNLFHAFMHKRRCFRHEQELRAVIGTWPREEELESGGLGENGIPVHVDLNALLEGIVISPFAPQWHLDIVERFISGAGLNIPVVRSPLNDGPAW